MRNITGAMINYYFVCKRKLWYFANYIELESESDDVLIGSVIDGRMFDREKHNVMINEVMNADFIKNGNIVHEIKKSDSCPQAGRWQVLFYLSELEKSGISSPYGIIHYEEQHRKEEVVLDDISRSELERLLCDIRDTISLSKPPNAERRQICKKCAYYEFCNI